MKKHKQPDFRVLFESSPGLFLVLSKQLDIVAVSDLYLEATHTRRNEILGKNIFAVFPDNPDDPTADGVAKLNASLQRVLNTGRPDVMAIQKYDIPLPAGDRFEERYWSPKNTPVLDTNGKVEYIIHQVEDVTEHVLFRKKSLQDEGKLNKFLETILENIPNMVFVKDAEHLRFVRFNLAGEKLLGLSRTELLGKSDYDFFPKEQADFFTAKDRAVLASNEVVDIPEEFIDTVHGRRCLHTRKIAIRDDEGNPRFLLGISEDITEQKKALEESYRLAILEHQNKELENFAYIMSHDLKTPLRGISNLCDWLLEDYSANLDTTGKEYLSMIADRIKRLQALINGVLSFISAGKTDLQPALIYSAQVVEEVKAMLSVPGVEIVVDTNLPEVKYTQNSLRLVFSNLVDNAIKHANKPLVKINIGCIDKGDHWEFYVKDNGPGIDEKFHRKVFDIFQTIKTKDEASNAGIGLAIVKKTIEHNGGEVWIDSAPEKGCTIFFTVKK